MLVTRSAIASGLDIEQAYQLSDIYITHCECQQSLDDLANLSFTMSIDFARRVAESKIPSRMSREIFDCVQFVTLHTNEPIQLKDVAEHIHRSRSYVTRKF